MITFSSSFVQFDDDVQTKRQTHNYMTTLQKIDNGLFHKQIYQPQFLDL